MGAGEWQLFTRFSHFSAQRRMTVERASRASTPRSSSSSGSTAEALMKRKTLATDEIDVIIRRLEQSYGLPPFHRRN
jgi:hypothetical protein